MVGSARVEAFDLRERKVGPVALRVEGLQRGDRVKGVSFAVRSGEILGLAGLVGSGRTETLRAIFGADRPDAGRIYRDESTVPIRIDEPRDAVRAGIGMIPEDRKQQGLLLSQSIRINTTLAHLRVVTRPRGWIRRMREVRVTEQIIERLKVQHASREQPVVQLSGGNQQKVVMARWLLRACDVLLFDEPTRGIDVAAKQEVYRLLGTLAEQGKAIVIVSSELRELTAICDRIAVMSAGRLVTTFVRGTWSEDRIMAASISGYLNRSGPRAAAYYE
jgi:ribose transport system ATP-binding protein